MSNSVKVAVRVRPFNDREKELNAKLCIEMKDATTVIYNLQEYKTKEAAKPHAKKFTFDYSFWSHDKENGSFIDQVGIFKLMGNEIIDQCWDGYNVSLFAYGQTGSGKSYSMIGGHHGKEAGLIPNSCEEIFRRIEVQKKEYEEKNVPEMDRKKFTVRTSMIEIYNEKVRDLFNPKNNPPGGMKVREHPKTGPYVVNLTENTVGSSEEILKWLDIGNKNKTIGSTKMNKTSSRAHTLFSILLKFTTQKKQGSKIIKTDITSKLNLVDLAGSEKLKNTGASGARMKEGININKSLTALGNCIKALADLAEGKKTFVPFRNSVLTKIMKESLGGNSKTIMIAALSPASSNYTETLSTLRYADRAKKIKTKAVRNEDEREKKIRMLTSEVKKLKALLAQSGIDPTLKLDDNSNNNSEKESEELKNLRAQLEEQSKLIMKMKDNDEEELEESRKLQKSNENNLAQNYGIKTFDRTVVPHIINLNEDPFIDSQLAYEINKSEVKLGKKMEGSDIDIPLDGIGVEKLHCLFNVEGNEGEEKVVTILPVIKEDVKPELFINGEKLEKKKKLVTGDRLVIGSSFVFKYFNPLEYKRLKKEGVISGVGSELGFEGALKELTEKQNQKLMKQQEVEMKKKMEELEKQIQKKKDEAEMKLKLEKEKNEEMLKKFEKMKHSENSDKKKLEALLKKQKEEFERAQEEMRLKLEKEREKVAKRLQKEADEKTIIENSLLKLIPMVKEVNYISKEMKLSTNYGIKIINDSVSGSSKIMVLVKDEKEGVSNLWNEDKFIDRLFLMKEVYEEYLTCLDNKINFKLEDEQNPFNVIEKGEFVMIGCSMVYLKSLQNFMGNELFASILDYKGKSEGKLKVEIIPCDEKGNEDTDEELFVSEAKELLGKEIKFKIKIPFARGITKKLSSNCNFRFQLPWLPLDDENLVQGPVCKKVTINPEWDFEKVFSVFVTQEVLDVFEEEYLKVQVYGSPMSLSGKGDGSSGVNLNLLQPETPRLMEKEEVVKKVKELEKEKEEEINQKKYYMQLSEEKDKEILILKDQLEELSKNPISTSTSTTGDAVNSNEEELKRENDRLQEKVNSLNVLKANLEKQLKESIESKDNSQFTSKLQTENVNLKEEIEKLKEELKTRVETQKGSKVCCVQ